MDKAHLAAAQNKIAKAAYLSKFAYFSANPANKISVDDEEARKQIRRLLGLSDATATTGDNFKRFASKLRNQKHENSRRWFRSQAYFYSYFDPKEDENKIVVAFRGTWLDPRVSREWYLKENDDGTGSGMKFLFSRAWNSLQRNFPPSNNSLSDLLYDATIVRIPYTDQTPVWKWYAFWGATALKWSNFLPLSLWTSARKNAADWIGRPASPNRAISSAAGDVHLGFWALWASDEGFAGYTRLGGPAEFPREGCRDWDEALTLPAEQQPRILRTVEDALARRDKSKKTEILVVGHSLGGAVSSFAALDLIQRHGSMPDVTITHINFGSPPVGSVRFRTYFNEHFPVDGRHSSWSVFHEQDPVAGCFSLLSTVPVVKLLGWWGDWAHTGTRVKLVKKAEPTADPLPPADERSAAIRFPLWLGRKVGNGVFWTLTGAGSLLGLVLLGLGNVLAVPTAGLYSICPSDCRQKQVADPPTSWGRNRDRLSARNLAANLKFDLQFHGLQYYVDHVVAQDFVEKADIVSHG